MAVGIRKFAWLMVLVSAVLLAAAGAAGAAGTGERGTASGKFWKKVNCRFYLCDADGRPVRAGNSVKIAVSMQKPSGASDFMDGSKKVKGGSDSDLTFKIKKGSSIPVEVAFDDNGAAVMNLYVPKKGGKDVCYDFHFVTDNGDPRSEPYRGDEFDGPDSSMSRLSSREITLNSSVTEISQKLYLNRVHRTIYDYLSLVFFLTACFAISIGGVGITARRAIAAGASREAGLGKGKKHLLFLLLVCIIAAVVAFLLPGVASTVCPYFNTILCYAIGLIVVSAYAFSSMR